MSQDDHFSFVKSLALELNRKEIKLTSFPDVVMRIRSALDDPDTSGETLANILSVDPVLASRVLQLANSTFYNPGGIATDGVSVAVGRIGFEKLRTTAIAYAVEMLHNAEGLAPLKKELGETWSAGLQLAAMAETVASKASRLDANSAFLAGLLNRIGVLYIFSKYEEYPTLLQDPESRQKLIDEWAAPIGESIVSNWEFSEEIRNTINPDDMESEQPRSEANLTDVIIASKYLLTVDDEAMELDTAEIRRLNLTEDAVPALMEAYADKLTSLAVAVA